MWFTRQNTILTSIYSPAKKAAPHKLALSTSFLSIRGFPFLPAQPSHFPLSYTQEKLHNLPEYIGSVTSHHLSPIGKSPPATHVGDVTSRLGPGTSANLGMAFYTLYSFRQIEMCCRIPEMIPAELQLVSQSVWEGLFPNTRLCPPVYRTTESALGSSPVNLIYHSPQHFTEQGKPKPSKYPQNLFLKSLVLQSWVGGQELIIHNVPLQKP